MNKKTMNQTEISSSSRKLAASRPSTHTNINKTADKISKKSTYHPLDDSNEGLSNLSKSANIMKNEISFTKVLLDFAIPTLEDVISMGNYEEISKKGWETNNYLIYFKIK